MSATFEEVTSRKAVIARNIVSAFVQPADDGIPVFPEEEFAKAEAEGTIEVFTVEAVSAFQRNLLQAKDKLGSEPHPIAVQIVEKAQKDLAKLVKVKKTDKNGKIMTYYVKPGSGTDGGPKKNLGQKMSQTEEGKHYVITHRNGDEMVMKRSGNHASGAPSFQTVDEKGAPQGEPRHFEHDSIVDVKPHEGLNNKSDNAKSKEEPQGEMQLIGRANFTTEEAQKRVEEFYDVTEVKKEGEFTKFYDGERVVALLHRKKGDLRALSTATGETINGKKDKSKPVYKKNAIPGDYHPQPGEHTENSARKLLKDHGIDNNRSSRDSKGGHDFYNKTGERIGKLSPSGNLSIKHPDDLSSKKDKFKIGDKVKFHSHVTLKNFPEGKGVQKEIGEITHVYPNGEYDVQDSKDFITKMHPEKNKLEAHSKK